MKICRICLEYNSRSYHLEKCGLNVFYEVITGISVEADLPLVLCWDCAHRLVKFWKFKAKARKSHELLSQIYHSHNDLSEELTQSNAQSYNYPLLQNVRC